MRIEYLTSKLKTNCDTVEEFINFDSFRNSEYSKLDKKYASLQLENSKFEKEVETNRIDAKHFERLKREKRDLADEIVNLQNDLNSLREKSDGLVEIFENSVNNNTTKKTKLKEKAKKLEKTIEELNITIADQKEMISTSNLSFHSISTEEIKGYFETSDLI